MERTFRFIAVRLDRLEDLPGELSMTLDEARKTVLDFLEQSGGRARNSQLLDLLGNDRELFDLVREALIFDDLVDDKKGVGLVLLGVPANGLGVPAKQRSSPRLFISYGRKDAGDLAARLKGDLENNGYKVWQDTEEIRTGSDFTAEIEEGLRNTQIVVALLSPHSVRRSASRDSPDGQDSVCLDELSFARFVVQPSRPILPVLVHPCEPPFVICRLDYIDLTQWSDSDQRYREGFERLIREIEATSIGKGPRYRSWEHELRPWDFSPFLELKRDQFTGREWLFDEIDLWRLRRDERALLITGDPGIGKSAIVAELVHQNPGGQVIAYHCCQADRVETLRPERFIRSLAAMIASRLPEFAEQLEIPSVRDGLSQESCETDPVSAFEEGILIPLQNLPAPEEGVRYLLVDALDESLTLAGEGDPRRSIIGILAGNLDRMPPWMRIVATTRNENGILNRLAGLRAHCLEATDPRNLEDLDLYLAQRLQTPQLRKRLKDSGMEASSVSITLREKGNGNFLYVVEAVRAMERSTAPLDWINRLPGGLNGLYIQFFDRLFQHDSETTFAAVRPLLQVVVAAREPLTADQLAEATGMNREEELPRWLRRFRQYLPPRITSVEDGAVTYAVYHKSLEDWLVIPDHDYFVSPAMGHQLLANWGNREFRRDPCKLSAYHLKHLPSHLVEAGYWKDLIGNEEETGVLCDLRFIEAKCAERYGMELSADFQSAENSLPELREQKRSERKARKRCRDYLRELSEYASGGRQHIPNPPAACEIAPEYAKTAATGHETPGERLQRFSGFFIGNRHLLLRHPAWTRPLAANRAEAGVVFNQAIQTLSKSHDLWFRREFRPPEPPLHPVCRAVMTGHSDAVGDIAASADFSRVISGSDDQTLRIWNLEGGECETVLRGHAGRVLAVIANADFSRALSAGEDQTIRLWNLEKGECDTIYHGHEGWVRSLSATSDFTRLLSGSDDKTLRLWNVESEECEVILEGHSGRVLAVAISPDGKRALSGGEDKTVRLWNCETGKCEKVMPGHANWVYSLVADACFTRALSGSWDQTMRLWNLESGECVRTFSGHVGPVKTVDASADFSLAITGSWDSTLRLWNLETGHCEKTIEGHQGNIQSVKVSVDFSQALSGSEDQSLRLWDIEGGDGEEKLDGHKRWVYVVAADAAFSRAISGSDDEALALWNIETGKREKAFPGQSGWMRSLVASADFTRALTGGEDQLLKIWNLETCQCEKKLRGHSGGILSVVADDQFARALTSSTDKTLRLWNLETGDCEKVMRGHGDWVYSVWASPDFRYGISGSDDQTVRLWNLESGFCERTLTGHTGRVYAVVANSNFSHALSGSEDGTLRLWNLESGKSEKTFSEHNGAVVSLVADPSFSYALSGSADRTLRLFEIKSGKCMAVYHAGSTIASIAADFSRGRFICGTEYGQMHFLSLRRGRDLASVFNRTAH